MFKIVIPAIMASTVALAAPAAAQYRGDYPDSRYSNGRDYDGRHHDGRYSDGREIRSQIDQMIDRIHRAEDRDMISKREEDRLMREARNIQRLYHRYRANGLNGREAHELQSRIQNLRQQFRFERQDGRRDGRW
jgi:Spy/CpxP family protein refolding chaperone